MATENSIYLTHFTVYAEVPRRFFKIYHNVTIRIPSANILSAGKAQATYLRE